MLVVFTKASAFLAIIAMGYILKRVGFFKLEDFSIISRIVTTITLPCAVIANFSKLEIQKTLLVLVAIGFGCNVITLVAGYLLALRKERADKAFYMINLSGYNIGSFAMPYVQNFLGPLGVVATCLFDAGNAVMCTGITYTVTASVAGKAQKGGVTAFLKRLFSSVTMDTYVVMLILSTLNLKLPEVLLGFAETVGGANSFLAMLMIGIGIERYLDESKIATVVKLVACRLAIAGALAAFFYFCLPLPLEIRQVLAVISFAPISSVCTAFTHRVGGDVALASSLNSISIMVSLVTMTALIAIMGVGI